MTERALSGGSSAFASFAWLLDNATNYGGGLIHVVGHCHDCSFQVDWDHRGRAQKLCREHVDETDHRVELTLGYLYRREEEPDADQS